MCLATCDVSMRMLHLVVVLVDLDMSMKVVHCSVAGSLMTSITGCISTASPCAS